MVKLTKKMSNPTWLRNHISNITILSFDTWATDSRLSSAWPIHRAIMKEHAIAGNRAKRVWVSCPICIQVGHKKINTTSNKKETMVASALDVVQDALDDIHSRNPWILYEQAHLLKIVGNVTSCDCEVLESTYKPTIMRRILDKAISLFRMMTETHLFKFIRLVLFL